MKKNKIRKVESPEQQRLRQWLKIGLESTGKTQKGLADILGIDQMGVSRMIRGDRNIQVSELPRIAAYIGEPPPGLHVSRSPDKGFRLELRRIVGRWMSGDTSAEAAMAEVAKMLINDE